MSMVSSIIGSVFSGIGGGLGAEGTAHAGETRYEASKFNVRVLKGEARFQIWRANNEAELKEDEGQRVVGEIKTGYAKAGVDTSWGSALEVMAKTEAAIRYDADMIRYGGHVEAARLKNQAKLEKYEGKQTLLGSRIGANSQQASSVGNSASSFGSMGGKGK